MLAERTIGVFAVLAVISSCQAVPVLLTKLLETGASTQYKSEDSLGNYAFGYTEDHTSGGSFRHEAGDAAGNKIGSYGLHDADGRARVVDYVADGHGFRADVKSNEPGVDPVQEPADVTVNRAAVVLSKPAAVVLSKPAAVVLSKPAAVVPAPVFHSHAHAITHAPLLYSPVVFSGGHIVL